MFFDIGRGGYAAYRRSSSEYHSAFIRFYGSLTNPITLFCDSTTRRTLEFLAPKALLRRIRFIDIDLSELPYFKFRSEVSEALLSSAMQFYSLRDRLPGRIQRTTAPLRPFNPDSTVFKTLALSEARAPEYIDPNYLIVTWSKPWIIKQALSSNSFGAGQRIAFMDWGFGHSRPEVAKRVAGRFLVDPHDDFDGISAVQRKPLRGAKSPWDVARYMDDAAIPAGLILGGLTGSANLDRFFGDSIKRWLDSSLAPDDQTLLELFASTRSASEFRPLKADFGYRNDGWYNLDALLSQTGANVIHPNPGL